MRFLVVGAGFAGAAVARELAEAGHRVLVVDKRPHIAGNAYDYVNEHGIRVHKYGPHLWHTSNDEVQEWASRFTEWVEYKHWVRAMLGNGTTVPLPINRKTLEALFADRLDDFAYENNLLDHEEHSSARYKSGTHAAFLETLVEKHAEVTNSRQHVENSVGKELCDLFFAPYTKKMWALELDQLPASVAARIPTNVESGSYLYFPKDKYQFLPKNGYTEMVQNILDHENIVVELNTGRAEAQENEEFQHVFTSEPIDTFFDCSLGELPWRSIKMHTYSVPLPSALDAPVVNFTHTGPHTRITEWKKLPAHGENAFWTTLTAEEPCDYKENSMERYYPVKTTQRDCPYRDLYNRYVDLAEKQKDVTFIGRCGTFQYLDMWAVIIQSLRTVRKFMAERN